MPGVLRMVSGKKHSQDERERAKQLRALLADNLSMHFDLLVLEYASKINAFVRQYMKEYTEDIVQETFLRAYRALSVASSDKILQLDFEPWLYKIARNLSLNHLNRYERLFTISLESFEVREKIERSTNGQLASPEEEFEWKETREELYSNINRLPDTLRQPVLLHYIHDLEYREIAEILDLPLNTAKSYGRRGWLQLQKIVKEGKE